MKKSHRAGLIAITAAAASVIAVSPVFAAGWQQNAEGWWYGTDAANTSWYSSGWQWIDGNGDGTAECYYFDANGYMLANTTTPDGYYVDANGAWIQNGNVQTINAAAGTGSTGAASGQSSSGVIIAADSSVYNTGLGKSTSSGSSSSSGSSLSTGASLSTSTSSGSGSSSSSNTLSSGKGTYSSSDLDDTYEEEKDFSSYAQECFDLINKKRVANGLDELEWDDTIAEACDIRAQELPEKFSHLRPNGELCFTVFDEVGIELSAKAENIAEGYSTPKAAVNAWMNSEGHKKNILNKYMTRAAIGFCYDPDSDYKYYWVQMFGRKRTE